MVESRPHSEPRIVKYEITYEVEDEFIEAQMYEHGVEVPLEWDVMIALRDLPTAEQRRRMVKAHERYLELEGYPTLARPTDDPVEVLDGLERWIAEHDRNDAALEEYEQEEREHQAAETRAFWQEMERWIALNGSPRLKRAFRRDYKVNRLYAEERAALEFESFYVDTSDSAEWRERTDPSEEALTLEESVQRWIEEKEFGVEVRIVWLVEPPASLAARLDDDEDLWGEFEQQEAITVAPYLGRYTLVMPVDTELRNSVPPSTSEHDEAN